MTATLSEQDKILAATIKKWFAIFDGMNISEAIEVSTVAKKDPKLFTDMCKCYIDGNQNYSFTNDYKFFKRDF